MRRLCSTALSNLAVSARVRTIFIIVMQRLDAYGNFQVHDLVKNELRSIRSHTVQWVLLEGVKYVVE